MTYEPRILQELDEDIRELLTLTHEIKIDLMFENCPDDKIKRALSLTVHIHSNLSNLLEVRK